MDAERRLRSLGTIHRVEYLPIVAGPCSLAEGELQAQIERYRAIGAGARTHRRSNTRLEVVLGPGVPDQLVRETVEIERSCCPFFDLDWAPEQRRLVFSVSRAQDEPALGAIARALGLPPAGGEPAASEVRPAAPQR